MTKAENARDFGHTETLANYVASMPPETFRRMTRREDPEKGYIRKAQIVVWTAMAAAAVLMVHANDFY